MMYVKSNSELRLPCAICKSTEYISEYILPNKYSFLCCDKCKIGAEAGRFYSEAVANWNTLMRSKPRKYFDWLEDHAHLEDKWKSEGRV